MKIKHMRDTGHSHEWRCEHGDCTYVVSYDYGAGSWWTVQRLRQDGLREVLGAGEAKGVLALFPKELRQAPKVLDSTGGEWDLASSA